MDISKRIVPKETPILVLARPFQNFVRRESSGGILLLACAIVALFLANSPWAPYYTAVWHTPLRFGLGDFLLSKELHFWVNDALMAVFFFVVGLEIKREILSWRVSVSASSCTSDPCCTWRSGCSRVLVFNT